ncbi:15876_t:CDS:1, partial [Dentiscutata heterogama]
KLFNKFFKKQQKKVEDTWDCGDEKSFQENQSSLLTNKEEEISFLCLLIENENQFEVE